MKKIIFISILVFGIAGNLSVLAHGIEEETRGKVIFEKLEAKEISCESLINDDFEAIGEYFMSQIAGTSHEAMNSMMIQMLGEEGEEQMHIAMGKRMSSCEPTANMMNNGVMGGGMMGESNNMMRNMMDWNKWNFRSGWAWLGWVFMILFWALITVWIIIPVKWLIDQMTGKSKEKSALDILKKRYAKGEISKEELEEKKKDLSL